MSVELLRRAWNALDTFKQAYPENWHEEDQQVMDDLIKADLDLSGVERKWQGLTEGEINHVLSECHAGKGYPQDVYLCAAARQKTECRAIEAKLKEKNI